MKNKEPKVMEEIHKIRARHYSSTKELSAKERMYETQSKAEEIIRKYNLKVLTAVNK
ncbi:MAG: hypothetical protein PHE88_02380 [Elusimicrobia bacterium]|nr:hypothetical protein [Elusimicrobiota bacterium]